MKKMNLKRMSYKELRNKFNQTRRTYRKHIGEEIYRQGGWSQVGPAPEIDKSASKQKQMAEMRKAIEEMRHTYNITIPNTKRKVDSGKYIDRWDNFTENIIKSARDWMNTKSYSSDRRKSISDHLGLVENELRAMSSLARRHGGYVISSEMKNKSLISGIINDAIFDSDTSWSGSYARFQEMIHLLSEVSMKLARLVSDLMKDIFSGEDMAEEEV